MDDNQEIDVMHDKVAANKYGVTSKSCCMKYQTSSELRYSIK